MGSAVCGCAGTNNTKQPCPVTNGTAVPAIRPVAVPQIVSLQGGQILIGNESAPQPTQIKVPRAVPSELSLQLQYTPSHDTCMDVCASGL